MHIRSLKSDLLLLLTSIIWGFAFVAQRVGMEYIGPFLFNGIRFALGSFSLIPLLLLNQNPHRKPHPTLRTMLIGGGLAGMALFLGASLQQIGMVYTTAGKAGFITGLYVVIVPILGIGLKQRTELGTWLGAVVAGAGLYLLSVTEQFTIAFGDLLELAGAFFWAVHMHVLSRYSRRIAPIKLALLQFIVCSCLSLLTAGLFEPIDFQAVRQATLPIIYGGLFSVGVAYTLQVVAQRDAHPSHAAILLSLETVFAAIGGWILLHEILSLQALLGCALMLSGMLLSQFNIKREHINNVLRVVFSRL